MSANNHPYPFAAVLGQEPFKLALMLAAVNPLVGGVLISGPRGSAKSTLAKSLATLLPSNNSRARPFIMLPLGATEEMLIGTLDLQKVIDGQQVGFQPGLLAKAHHGILYVDEVNLLPDNLVDQLLDVATSGVNLVERDGISHQHESSFVLLGTMNPDEGELRPQFTDRFGLSVDLGHRLSVEERVAVVELREAYEANAEEFYTRFTEQQDLIADQIASAQSNLANVSCAKAERILIAQRCNDAGVDGMRADIVWLQAAKAHAALNNQTCVRQEDIVAVEEFVLNHRRKNNSSPPENKQAPSDPPPFKRPEEKPKSGGTGDWGAMEQTAQKTEAVAAIELALPKKHTSSMYKSVGLAATNRLKGQGSGTRNSVQKGQGVQWFSTLVTNIGQWPLKKLIHKPKKLGQPIVNIIVLDTSGSVLANHQFGRAKGAILQIVKQAYLQREQLSIVSFGNNKAETLLPMRRAPKQIVEFLDTLKASGGTPLQEGIVHAKQLQQQMLAKHFNVQFNNYIITDGRVTKLPSNVELLGTVTVIDVEATQVKRGKAVQIANTLKARYVPLMAQ